MRQYQERITIEFDGAKFHRYPKATDLAHRRYYTGYWRDTKTNLHRATWTKANGPIPKGHHIHHKNGDTEDNRLQNLELVTPRQHIHEHWNNARHRASQNNIKKAIAAAPIWHASEEGIRWHREHASSWRKENRKRIRAICSQCGNEYQRDALSAYSVLHCSGACRAKARRISGKDDADWICKECGITFRATKFRVRMFCSKSWSSTRMGRQRRSL